MKKWRILLEIASIALLVIPNLIFLICNIQVFKTAHIVAITMVALVVLSVVGLGAMIHFKVKSGIWMLLIGVFVVAWSNISYYGGIALIIEGVALAIDGYFIRPLIVKQKIKELEANGKSVTYTRNIE